MEVFCDFDSVHLGKMYTVIENREIVLDKTCCAETWMFLLSNLEEGKDDYLVWDIITRPEYMCTQEVGLRPDYLRQTLRQFTFQVLSDYTNV